MRECCVSLVIPSVIFYCFLKLLQVLEVFYAEFFLIPVRAVRLTVRGGSERAEEYLDKVHLTQKGFATSPRFSRVTQRVTAAGLCKGDTSKESAELKCFGEEKWEFHGKPCQ